MCKKGHHFNLTILYPAEKFGTRQVAKDLPVLAHRKDKFQLHNCL